MVEKTDEELTADDLRYFGTSFVRHHADGRRERIDPREVFVFRADHSKRLAKVWLWSFFLTLAFFAIFAAVLFSL